MPLMKIQIESDDANIFGVKDEISGVFDDRYSAYDDKSGDIDDGDFSSENEIIITTTN